MDSEYNPKLALIEAETRHRHMMADEPDKLESILRDTEEKTVELQKKIDADIRAVNSRKREMLSHLREVKFYQDKIDQLDQNKLKTTIAELRNERISKQADLSRLRKSLEEFAGMEPTEFSLNQRIEELKASRLSLAELEMTFVGDSP